MNNNPVDDTLGLIIFLALPVVGGLMLLIKARVLVHSQRHSLRENDMRSFMASETTVMLYRMVGVILIAVPIIIFLIGTLAFKNPHF